MKAKEFFMLFYNADCPRIAIENPMTAMTSNRITRKNSSNDNGLMIYGDP